jgi:outer membrane biosynthesis protein TonB
MHPWASRTGAVLLSLALHALVLLSLRTSILPRLDFPESAAIPVTLLPSAAPAAPPPASAQASEIEEPAPEPAPEKEEQREEKIPLPEQQVVSPSEGGEEKPPPDTRLLSERDSTVEEQMVRHGEPAPAEEGPEEQGAGVPGEKDRGNGRAADEATTLASLPPLERLLPSAIDLADAGYGRAEEGDAKEKPGDAAKQRRRSADAWLPSSDVWGTLDFLPDVQSGNITLLNTKAELYAPFVRRVALRVFQNLLISLRHELSRSRQATEETVTMEAIMTPRGDLLATKVTERSAQLGLGTDRLLQLACTQGFFDRNPPPGAEAEDGNIHFLLRTRVLAMVSPNRAQYGYRIAFQAGLL